MAKEIWAPMQHKRNEVGQFATLDHCPNGHARTPENIYVEPASGKRKCRECRRAQSRRQVLTPERNSWRAMWARCTQPTHSGWKYYGARGISVCPRWAPPGGFENFLADMGPRPEGLTLDRIDPDGDYGPENCRWATPLEQSRNRRHSGGQS